MFFPEEILYTVIIRQRTGFFISQQSPNRRKELSAWHMNNIKEGELYKTVEIHGHRIELRYGYYEDYERERGEPIPIYPNLKEKPIYTKEGYPIVTQMQDLCKSCKCRFTDGCCGECEYFRPMEEMFGICSNPENKKKTTGGT